MEEWVDINERTKVITGKSPESAGTGFGMRDQQFTFEDRDEALRVQKELSREFGIGEDDEEQYCVVYVVDEEGYAVDEDGRRLE